MADLKSHTIRMRRRARLPSSRWIGARLFSAVIAIWGALTLVFFALEQLGAPISMFVQEGATPDEMEQVKRILGYDRPPVERYFSFLGSILTGDYPLSLQFQRPPMAVILERFPSTLLLAASAMAIGLTLAGALGYLGAFSASRTVRRGVDVILGFFQSIPTFFLALVFIYLFSVQFRWLPASGSSRPVHLILPAVTLAFAVAIPSARIFRSSLLGIAGSDYVRTARASGRSEFAIRLRHIVPNAFVPVFTVLGMHCANLLGGAAVVESIFRWPGVGQLLITAAATQDYPMVLATVCFSVLVFIVVNIVIDILVAFIDPRVRLS